MSAIVVEKIGLAAQIIIPMIPMIPIININTNSLFC